MDLTVKSLIRVLAGGALVLDKTLNAKNTNLKNTEVFQDGRKNFENLNMLKANDYSHHKMFTKMNSSAFGFNDDQQNFDFKGKSASPLWTKSDINLSQNKFNGFNSFYNLNDPFAKEDDEKPIKKVVDTSSNSSTMPLHIRAYEEAHKDDKDTGVADNATKMHKSERKKMWKEWKNPPKKFNSSLDIQNPFEIPRQQENETSTPEVAQFKASQKLFNPNTPINFPERNIDESRESAPPPKKSKKVDESSENNTPKRAIITKNSLRDLGNLILSSPPVVAAPNNQSEILNEKQASPTSSTIENLIPQKAQKTIDILRKGLNDSETKINAVEEENKRLVAELKRAREDLHNLKKLQKRTIESKELENEELENAVAVLKNENMKQQEEFNAELEKFKNLSKEDQQEIQALKNEIFELNEELKQFATKNDIALLFVDGKYTPATKFGLAGLHKLGVPIEKQGAVIETVLKMVGLTPNRTPSKSTAARASFILKALNEAQLREILRDAAEREIATTLGSDESTKNGKKLEAFVYYTLDEEQKAREYCLGLVEIIDKSAATAIEKLKRIIQHLESEEASNYWETFLMTVGNVISDQAATQKKFNDLLVALKNVIVENDERYANLNSEQKADLCKLRKFYCQLHILQNATPVVTNILLEHEKKVKGNDQLTEATVVKFIKNSAKLISGRAASKYDVHVKWVQWAQRNNVQFPTVPDFKGHRFNILFAIAGAIQYLKEPLLNFNKEFKTQLRDICFEEWMSDPLTSSHLLLLAAVNEFITAPFWRLTENDSSVSSITAHAQSLIDFLERVKKEPILLLSGEPPLQEYEEDFEITQRSKAHIEKLDKTEPQHPLIISEAIEDVAEALSVYFQNQFKEFLPGGANYQSAEKTETVPRSNRKCESIFGLTSWDFQNAPNKRTAVREAKILAIVNKVFDWYEKKSSEEKEKILMEAIAAAPKLEADNAAQQKAFEDATWKRLLQQKEADDKAELVKSRKERDAFNKVQKYGGEWKSIDSMNAALQSFKNEAERKKAITDNLRYHKLVLKTLPSNSKLFTITFNGRAKNLSTLKDNLSALIAIANEDNNEDDGNDNENDDEY